MNKGKFALLSLLLSLLAVGGVTAGSYFMAPIYFQENGLVTLLFGMGGGAALLLWGLLQLLAPRAPETAPPAPVKTAAVPVEPQIPAHASAVQLLSILQRQGRFLDFFVKEDLGAYDDAQIGAAVRNVHEGCKKALSEYFIIQPIMTQPEGSEVTVNQGFNANEIRLVGNVTGNPPFKGALMHHGWRVKNVKLPKIMKVDEKDMILAAAEVEIG